MPGIGCGLAAMVLAIGLVSSAQACNLEQVALTRFQPEIDQWSDGSGSVVRLIGTIVTKCNAATNAELSIDELDKSGHLLGTRPVWVENIPPGGQEFDIVGRIPYDPRIAAFKGGIVRTE